MSPVIQSECVHARRKEDRVGVDAREHLLPKQRTAQGDKDLLGLGANDELGVRGRHDDLAPLAVLELVNVDLCEGKAATDLLCDALNLDLLAHLRPSLVRNVDVDAHAGLLTQVPSRDRHATCPVHDRSAHRTVQGFARVHVVVAEDQPGEDVALGGMRYTHWSQQEVIDGAAGQLGLDEVLNMSVLGRL